MLADSSMSGRGASKFTRPEEVAVDEFVGLLNPGADVCEASRKAHRPFIPQGRAGVPVPLEAKGPRRLQRRRGYRALARWRGEWRSVASADAGGS